MRLGRIASTSGVAFVKIDDGEVTLPSGQPNPEIRAHEIKDHPFGEPTFTGRSWPLADVRLLAPILASKVICIGKNYADHAAEMGSEAPADPVIFMKPSTTIIGPEAAIVLPPTATEVHYEGELAVVIGRPAKSVSEDKALDVVLGYTCANDVTARDHQSHDVQWTRGKSHDTFCPLGPWIETDLDASDVGIRTALEGAVKQDSRTALLLHDIPKIIAWVSEVMTLLPGDVILTGTPAGVGPIHAGEMVEVTIEGIGTLRNPVANRA
ncbi:fumarylacetoacetate hydrolase family protein [Tomitella biformata]|uniref:fumarylacetoacetate hydrolase family protein n=1 Tax=Tomitella biformata TaxID=630403 RepID=UPI000464EFE5|nr:fumarylacetoacetate hydrolase family protein [Tomitella biformata]